MEQEQFSKYEKARMLGARALQISMDAPVLVKMDDEALSDLNYDPLKIAELEIESGVLPISVKRPMPKKHEEDLEKLKIKESKLSDGKKKKKELEEEQEIAEEGDIMALANPEDEQIEEAPVVRGARVGEDLE